MEKTPVSSIHTNLKACPLHFCPVRPSSSTSPFISEIVVSVHGETHLPHREADLETAGGCGALGQRSQPEPPKQVYNPQTSSDSLLCVPLLYSLGIQNMTFISAWASLVAPVLKNLPANAGDTRDIGSTPGLGRSPGGGHGNPLQYSCLENPHGQRSLAGYGP